MEGYISCFSVFQTLILWQNWFQIKKKRASENNPAYEFDRQLVKDWFKLFQSTLLLNQWIQSPTHDVNCVISFEDTEQEPLAQIKVRKYMKRLVKRTKGVGLVLTKFHHLLHMVHYILLHGSMLNFDGSRPESIAKSLVKDPGQRTQHQVSKLSYHM